MNRYVALLRGVSPSNANMGALRSSFEAAGLSDVRTVLASGNVIFSAPPTDEADLVQRCESAMQDGIGRSFATIIRPRDELRDMITADPFINQDMPVGAKAVVTFLPRPPAQLPSLPISRDGVTIFAANQRAVYTYYVVSSAGPVFMNLLEHTFGKTVTTRTWQTVRRCANA